MVSISVSLVAVFIPLLLMGGIVGRLFREFALTVTAAIAVSVLVSLTLDADARLALPRARRASITAGSIARSSACSTRWSHAYARGLDVVLRHRFVTLMTFFATIALTGRAVRR